MTIWCVCVGGGWGGWGGGGERACMCGVLHSGTDIARRKRSQFCIYTCVNEFVNYGAKSKPISNVSFYPCLNNVDAF